jgi:hypothetical protein
MKRRRDVFPGLSYHVNGDGKCTCEDPSRSENLSIGPEEVAGERRGFAELCLQVPAGNPFWISCSVGNILCASSSLAPQLWLR